MPGKKPDKKELARMKVMADLGVSASAIGKRIGRRHNTVIKYLRSEVYNDPSVNKLVALIKEKELADLYLLGAMGRAQLHELMDDGKSNMIQTIALVDRTFQQRRLLEGPSTQKIATLTKLIETVQDAGDKSLRHRVLTD